MPDAFVPLIPTKPKTGGNGGATAPVPSSSSVSQIVQSPMSAAKAGNGSDSDNCSKPVVTLKKEGNTVTGIHVQCGCGRVLELDCVY